jgi:hypothetical protein
MPQHIHIELRKGYLHVDVSGEFNLAKAKEFIHQIMRASHQHSVWKIFIDIRKIEGPIPNMARFELARLLAAGLTTSIRLAVLESAGQVPDDKFFENVAVNRGAMVKVTTDLEEAVEWLEIEPAQKGNAGDR